MTSAPVQSKSCNMSKARQVRQEPKGDYIVAYTRLNPEDYDELRRREGATGATIAAQIRILVHEALHRKAVIR